MRQLHHITYATVLLTAWLGATWACSGDPSDPGDPQISVFYANVRSHEGNEAPGTAIVTWLSPGTVGEVDSTGWPSGGLVVGYLPGFHSDTVHPGEQSCVRFDAPSDSIAVEMTETFADGTTKIGTAGYPNIVWSTATAWGFNGDQILPAGDGGYYGVSPGC